MSVPEDATAALAIHQPGSGRIWIGTAPDGGDVGLAYTDDGGASWTDVELPEPLRRTSEELLVLGSDDLLVVAASGDHVAVTEAWGGPAGPSSCPPTPGRTGTRSRSIRLAGTGEGSSSSPTTD